uniref:NUC153 domain-containing protein n=1 Tax=Heterorhabditis bacteriophora TaxID=37862 RepID=A0A1I7XJS6_HETBA
MNQNKMGKNLGLADDRFKHLTSDPKFSQLSNINKKVVIGKRFAAALTDARFSSRARVDKRGRRMKKTTGNDLIDLYDIEGNESDSSEDLSVTKKILKIDDNTREESIKSEEISESNDEISDDELIKVIFFVFQDNFHFIILRFTILQSIQPI